MASFYVFLAQNGITGDKVLSIPEEALKHLPPKMQIIAERKAGVICIHAKLPEEQEKSVVLVPTHKIIELN